jgi:hypothetical protein
MWCAPPSNYNPSQNQGPFVSGREVVASLVIPILIFCGIAIGMMIR